MRVLLFYPRDRPTARISRGEELRATALVRREDNQAAPELERSGRRCRELSQLRGHPQQDQRAVVAELHERVATLTASARERPAPIPASGPKPCDGLRRSRLSMG